MIKEIESLLEGRYEDISEKEYMITITCKKDNLIEIISILKENKYNSLTDLTAVDYPDRSDRFEMIYNLLSIFLNSRIIIKTQVKDKEDIPSITKIFSAASWYEREVWDMFGIKFSGNEDLRRILTDYEFEGHPLRKDFPLTGYKEVRYDEDKKKVIYEPVNLQQDYRNFDFLSPWEGPKYGQ